jgi:hypothetical protein
MSARAIIGITAICVFLIGMFVANMFRLLMTEEIDHKRPELNLYSTLGFRHLRSLFGYREYRDACPNGKLHIYLLASLAVAMVGMIALVVLSLISLASPRIE